MDLRIACEELCYSNVMGGIERGEWVLQEERREVPELMKLYHGILIIF